MKLESTKHQRAMKRIKLSFVLLLSAMVLVANLPAFADTHVHVPGKIYYVAPTGSDENDGSLQAPWRTLQHAADVVKAGEKVFVRGGTYRESIIIKNSGSASSGYITFQAYPGETPVISGASSGVSSLVYFKNAHYIVFDGFELTDLVVNDSSIYVSAIKVREQSSNLIIQNNHIHKIKHTAKNGNANGIVVYGNSKRAITNILISNNYLHDLELGSSEAITIVGNVDGFRVENNVIEHVNNIAIDAAGFYNTCPSGCVDQARNGLIAGNQIAYVDTVSNAAYGGSRSAAGIYIDGGTKIVVERNVVFNSNYGLSIASEQKDQAATDIIVRNNYIHHNHKSGIILGGSSSNKGGASDNLILNNTFLSNNELRSGDGEITFQNAVKKNVFANNLFLTNRETPYFHDSKTTNIGNTIDYNLYHAVNTPHSTWRLGGVRYTDFEQYQKATKHDQNSVIGESGILEKSIHEFELAPTSRAIDSGTLQYKQVGELDIAAARRIVGNSIDIGAIEFNDEHATEPLETDSSNTEPYVTEPVTTTPPTGEIAPFVVDGLEGDWENEPAITSSSSNARSIKSTIASEILYVLITGQRLQEKSQLYINSGEESHSYFAVPFWSDQKADYLLENGILYKYAGSGKDWRWNKIKDYRKREVVIHSSAIELGIPLSDLSSNGNENVKLGFIWNDSEADQLPAGGEMATPYGKR